MRIFQLSYKYTMDKPNIFSKKRIILRFILLKINQGFYSIGDKLPSEQELAIKFNCNRHTISSVYKELIHKDIVKFIAGKGNYLKNRYSDMIDAKNFIYFNKSSLEKISYYKLPLKLLSKYEENYSWIMKQKLFYEKKLLGIRYFIVVLPFKLSTIEKNMIKPNKLMESLSNIGLPAYDIKQNISFLKNNIWPIKDKYVVESQISFSNEVKNNNIFIYSIYSAERTNFTF